MTAATKVIFFCRHGQTDHNIQGLLQGSGVISVLNEEGLQQAELLSKRLGTESVGVVITSPLERARKTAEAVHSRCGDGVDLLARGYLQSLLPYLTNLSWSPLNVNAQLDENLQEISWGDWEGKPITPEFSELAKRWRDGQHHERAPNGESLATVDARARKVIDDLKRQKASKIVVVGKLACPLRLLATSNHPSLF